uniref:hypothetical protein n=1 Tax=Paractinoplanes polyasparticus TaxID=2856853 RepID=UPI001C84BC5B|nr:hypothetical protein [Actinoplanes polyasparticus]
MVATGGKLFASDFNTLVTLTLQRPLVRLIQQAAQSIPNTADTALTFGAGSEDIDTHGFHDTSSNTSRVTPTVAGYYQLYGVVWWGNADNLISYHAGIGKNGSVAARQRTLLVGTTAATTRSINAAAIIAANGTTDYFELFAQQGRAVSASLSTNVGGTFSSMFECMYLRPL